MVQERPAAGLRGLAQRKSVRAARPSGPAAARSGTADSPGTGSGPPPRRPRVSRSSSATAVRLDPRLEGVAPHERELGLPEAGGRAQRTGQRRLVHARSSRSARRRQPGLAASAASARPSGCAGTSPPPRSSARRCRSAVPRVGGVGAGPAPGKALCLRCRGNRSPGEGWHSPLTIEDSVAEETVTDGNAAAAGVTDEAAPDGTATDEAAPDGTGDDEAAAAGTAAGGTAATAGTAPAAGPSPARRAAARAVRAAARRPSRRRPRPRRGGSGWRCPSRRAW